METKRLFTIGEIAAIKGMTVKALRFYEKIGLLKPCHIDPFTRYRYYSIEQFIYLDIIKASRAMDISPKALKEVVDTQEMNELIRFLAAQKKRAERKIEEMRRSIRNMEEVERAIKAASDSLSRHGVYVKNLPERNVITLAFPDKTSTEDAIIGFSSFDRIIEENRLTNTYEAGVLFRYDETAGAQPDRLFNAVRIHEDTDPSILSVLPAGDYVCTCYSISTAAEHMMLLTGYLQENGLQPQLILQVELLNNIFSIESSCFEMQILI